MKLSDIKGPRVMDVMADVIEHLSSIMDDKEVKELIESIKKSKASDGRELMDTVLPKLPAIIRGNGSDVIAIMASINGVTEDEYADNMTMQSLITDVKEILTDEDFLSFLA